MKLVVAFLCACVAGSLGSLLPAGAGAAKVAAVGVGKLSAGSVKVGDKSRDAKQTAQTAQDWANKDQRKYALAKEWADRRQQSSADNNAKEQDYAKASSGSQGASDASNKHAAKSGAAANGQAGKQQWAARSSQDQNQFDTANAGWRNGNRRHEGIKYAFDKKFDRNANEKGGFNAGSKLADHAVDDWAEQASAYDRVLNDDAARAGKADRQNADRAASYGNSAWANRGAWDKFGRDANQAAKANANDRDWAEKRDQSVTDNRNSEAQRTNAGDSLVDNALLDRSANRKTVGFGASHDAKLGKNYGYGGYQPYGYANKGYGAGVVGKDYERAAGGSDASNLWDNAQRQKQQKWAGDNWEDRTKDSLLANQWQEDKIQGYNKDQAASLNDNGFANEASSRDAGAKAQNQQWADANAAKAASQASRDLDEVVKLRSQNKWQQSDRDHKRDEWKNFNNDASKDGQNWERLKYNRDQTDDAAAADFSNRYNDANRWRDSHLADNQAQSARSAETARASDAANRRWDQDNDAKAAAQQNQAAAADWRANRGVWGSDADRRKQAVDQAKSDYQNKDQQAWNRGTQQAGFDTKALGGSKNHVGGAYGNANFGYPVYGDAHGYGYGYPNNYGYGYGYPAGGYGYPGYGNKFGYY